MPYDEGMIKQDRGAWFSVTASGTATAIATQAASTAVIYFITDISASTNASAGTVTVYGGATGTTALWTSYIGANNQYDHTFSTPLVGIAGQAVKVQAFGSLTTYANISGFQINAS